jgi:hypothetical protein
MLAAAAAQQFEKAAALRDRFVPLRWLHRCLERLRQARGLSFVYPLQSYEGKELWYVVCRGQVRAMLPAPADAEEVAALFAEGSRAAESVDGVLLVDGWFRKHPEERQRTLTPEEALTRCSAQNGKELATDEHR